MLDMNTPSERERPSSPLVTSEADILEELVRSKARGSLVGVVSPALGSGLFICSVVDIRVDMDEHDLLVVLDNTIHRSVGDRCVLYLKEIVGVYLLAQQKQGTAR